MVCRFVPLQAPREHRNLVRYEIFSDSHPATLQMLLGIFFFVVPKPAQRIRAAFLPIHSFAGIGIYFCGLASLITGILDRILIAGALTYTPLNPIWRGANFYMLTLGFTLFGVLWHTRARSKRDDDSKYTAINAVGTLEYNSIELGVVISDWNEIILVP
jgi:hypothetical protein